MGNNLNPAHNLRLDWVGFSVARFACERWHYSGVIPAGKRVMVGAWEEGKFLGVVIFSTGAAPQIGEPFGLKRTEVCELTRVALRYHRTPVSRIVAIAVRLLRRHAPGIRLVVSYADPLQHHHGGIYQAGNWLYLGRTKCSEHFFDTINLRFIHSKTLKTGKRGYATQLKAEDRIRSVRVWKHKYVLPLDDKLKPKLLLLSQPYPKRAPDQTVLSFPEGKGGVKPTRTLHKTAEVQHGRD